MKSEYLGWVPCISGHLDFGLMKPTISGGFTKKEIKGDSNCINFGYLAQKDHHARRIMIQSDVDWRDRLSSDEYDGSFRVFVLADASETACMDNRDLCGNLYIYPTSEQEHGQQENTERPWLSEIRKANKIFDQSAATSNGWEKYQAELNQCYDNLEQILESAGFWRVDFKVTCGGLIFLAMPTETYRALSDQEKYLITRQSYYYLKYSLHSHKHHQVEQDSLTTIVPYYTSLAGRRDAALKLLCQLKRELTHIKRTLTQEQRLYSDDALGMLSYTGSLLTTLHSCGMIDDNLYQRESSYIESLRSSFQTQESRSKNYRAIEDSARSRYRVYIGWFLALVSLFFGIVARPFYKQIPDSGQIAIPPLTDLILLTLLLLLVTRLVYQKVSAYMISSKLDEASIRHFVQSRYHQGRYQLVRSFLEENRKVIFVFLLLVVSAFSAYWV